MQEESQKIIENFSVRLRGLRAKRGLTQGDLAAEIGVSPGSVGNWESGFHLPGPVQLRKLADFFGTNTGFFYGDEASPPREDTQQLREPATRYGEAHYYESDRRLNDWECPDEACYALEWMGDAMEPMYRSGDLVVASPNSDLHDGDLVIAKLEDDSLLLRVYHRREKTVYLTAYRADVYPIIERKIDQFRFIHPVWQVVRPVKRRGCVGNARVGESQTTGDNEGAK